MDKGGYTPHEPFRSHQDWEGSLSLLLLNPSLHDDLHGCLAHLPRALISVPDWSRVGAWLPAARPLPTLLLDAHGGKGRSPLSPAPPLPAPGGARPLKKKVDRKTEPWNCGWPLNTSPRPLAGKPPSTSPPDPTNCRRRPQRASPKSPIPSL